MSGKKEKKNGSMWKAVDKSVLIPGGVCLLLVVVAGAAFPEQFESMLGACVDFIMAHFKWLYIICVCAITIVCFWLIFGRYGSIRLGGKKAKPSFSLFTWCTLSLTGTIAVGICFYGVSGPVNAFMNPPEFMHVAAGSPEAVIPSLKYCFLHYGIPPYFLMVFFAMILALVYYNGKRDLRGSSTLFPLIGEKSKTWIGNIANILMVVCLIVCGTNMGLAVIQLNAGIGTVAGMDQTPSFEVVLIIIYTVATVIFATSGAHKLMGYLSNVNAVCYAVILVFVILATSANETFTLLFTALGEFVRDFIPMISFGDPVYQTGWQSSNSMFYYAWNLVPALMQALFYVSIAYGRTLRQFLLVNCLLPCTVVFTWYAAFGGNAMMGILNGSDLFAQMQQFGDGIATFAFLDTLPLGTVMKWVFIIVAMMTFITFSDSVAYSFPMLLMKKTSTDVSLTKIPKSLNAAVAIFMGVLTMVLLFVGGYDALNQVIVALGFPAVIFTLLVLIAGVKFILHRDRYDATYIEEMEEERQREQMEKEKA
ncbi:MULTISPECIES: BCCT family transporter [Eubacterium]|uniref:BCCT family transporter n=1 Tax=Eubacterium TaxID=1730 RepID=UPI001314532E|nr:MULTISPECIES: BCCT family transporter [Eubacterium]